MALRVAEEVQLEQLREAIDTVDAEILRLVARRVELVLRIAEFKRARQMPVYDPTRERAVIERLLSLAPPGLDPQLVRRIFERVIDESRRLEQHQGHLTTR
jgi:chorismate mutase